MLLSTPKSLPLRLSCGRVRALHRPRRLLLQRVHIPAAAARPNRSFDDELERSSLDDEFQKSFDPARYQRVADHLNLLWEVSKRKQKPEECESCSGSGDKECTWCNGTGVMTIGDTLYCDSEGCRPCPVCRGMGQCKCQHCRGTGRRAKWIH